MNKDEAFRQVREIVAESLGKDLAEITLEVSFADDLDADSLDLVELVMELEERFGIKISDDEAQGLTTVGTVVDFIVDRTGE
jgi:acyl carrier protein